MTDEQNTRPPVAGLEDLSDNVALARRALHDVMDTTGGKVSIQLAMALADLAGRDIRTIRRWQRERLHPPEPSAPREQVDAFGVSVSIANEADVEETEPSTVLERLVEFGPSAFEFDKTMMALMYLMGGHQVSVRDALVAAGYPVPSLSTFSRKWSNVPRLQRDGAKHGLKNRSKHLLHIRHSAAAPNEAWQFDSFNLDIYVRRPGGTTPLRPWLLLLEDDHSRFITSWSVLTHQMHSADVLAAFGAGFDVRPADDGSGVLIGGYPKLLLFDNERSIRSNVVREALDALPMGSKATPAYTPTAKAKIERVGATIQAEVVVGQPGQVTQSERPNGEHLLQIESEHLMRFDQLVGRVADAVYRYNYETVHGSLGGKTPFEVYSNATPLRRPTDSELASLMIPVGRGGVRKVAHDGIQANGGYYVEAGLADHLGKELHVKSWPHDHRRIAVFEPTASGGETFLQMVPLGSELDADQRRAIMEHRIGDIRAVHRHAKGARDAMRELAKGASSPTGAVLGERTAAGTLTAADADAAGDEMLANADSSAAPPEVVDTGGDGRSKAARPSSGRGARNSTMKKPTPTRSSQSNAEKQRADKARKMSEQSLDDDGAES